MEIREFPVLAEDDADFVARLKVGLGDHPARVLAYLLLRAERDDVADERASLLTLRVGTGMNRNAVRDALSRLRDRDLVTATTVQAETRGRPPQAWYAPYDCETAVERVYDRHAEVLVRRARTAFDVDGDEGDPDADRNSDSNGSDDAGPNAPDAETAGSGRDDETAELDSNDRVTTVSLNWTPNGLHLPLYAAAGRGEYADRGLSVAFEPHDGSSASLAAVSTGDADVGVAGAVSVLRARQRGEPVVPVALLFQRAMTVLYADRDRFGAKLESVEQLRGRRIGMPFESEAGLLARLFLSQSGVLADVELVDLPGEEQRALRSGEADVVTGSFSDPRALREEGVLVDALPVADHFPIYGPSLVTTEETLRQRDGLVADFLASTMAGWAAATRRPQEVPTPPEGTFDDRERRTFEQAAAEFGASDAVRENGWGWQDPETWNRLETALSMGTLDADPSTGTPETD